MVFGLPESPRYLYKHGRHEEALQILFDVYDGTSDDPKIEKENREVLEALKWKKSTETIDGASSSKKIVCRRADAFCSHTARSS